MPSDYKLRALERILVGRINEHIGSGESRQGAVGGRMTYDQIRRAVMIWARRSRLEKLDTHEWRDLDAAERGNE